MRATTLAIFLLGCNGGDDKGGDGPGGTVSETTPAAPLAEQVSIGKISAYQGVEAVLWTGSGAPTTMQPPILAGREAAVRVFLRPEAAFEGGDVTVELTVTTGGVDTVLGEVTKALPAAGVDEDLDSTFNFDLTADQVGEDTELRVTIRAADGAAGDTLGWDSAVDLPDGLPTEATDDLTLVVIPVQYDADGSGRLPDTSQAVLDELRDAMFQVYPARSVTVRVGEVLPWDQNVPALNPFPWQRLLDAVSTLRGEADEPPNTYYFGLFVPEDGFEEYCDPKVGCVLGLSELGFNTTNPSLRTSIGVGYPEVRAMTVVHEVGHAHGRFHADCGGALGTDPNYPYPDALIGSWGYDLLASELKDPSVHTDFMAYCTPTWVSNYTWFSLWERIAELAAQAAPGARVGYRRVSKLRTDGAGATEIVGTVRVGDPTAGGIGVDVDLFDATGAPAGQVPGWLFPNSHFPGGVVTLDHVLPDGFTARVHDPSPAAIGLYHP